MDCIITDPPYYRVASELYKKPGCEWDDQWPDMQHYLRWMGELIGECFRVLKDNGSLYIFADTLMAWRISQLTEEAGFIQLNDLVWKKNNALPMKFWRNIRTGRHYLGWEQDSGYYEQMQERLKTETYRKKAITTLDGY